MPPAEPKKFLQPELLLSTPTAPSSNTPSVSTSITSRASSTQGRCMGEGAQGAETVCGKNTELRLDGIVGSKQLQSTAPTIFLTTISKGLVSTISDEKLTGQERFSTERVHTNTNFDTPLKESPKKPLPTSQIVYIKPLLKPPYVKNKEQQAPTSNGPVASTKYTERKGGKASNTSQIIYISLVTQPTKASRPSEGH